MSGAHYSVSNTAEQRVGDYAKPMQHLQPLISESSISHLRHPRRSYTSAKRDFSRRALAREHCYCNELASDAMNNLSNLDFNIRLNTAIGFD